MRRPVGPLAPKTAIRMAATLPISFSESHTIRGRYHMSFVRNSRSRDAHRRDDRLRAAVRDVRVQLSVLNHRVAARAGVKDVDFDCLDLISIHGPISPGGLAKLAGLHPAT